MGYRYARKADDISIHRDDELSTCSVQTCVDEYYYTGIMPNKITLVCTR